MSITRRALAAACVAAFLTPGAPVRVRARSAGSPGGGPLTIFAAASLRNALDEVAKLWVSQGRLAPRISYAGSNALARQIEQGAPADLFLSADAAWMDHLAKRGLILQRTRRDLLANRIALIAPRGSPVDLALTPGADLAGALGAGRLAMAHVEAVPAGRYGKAALETLGLWRTVEAKVAQTENVRAALLLVSRGEAPLGIVYTTDAASDPGVRIVATLPDGTHPPIVYPVAGLTESRHPGIAEFIDHLAGPEAAAVFTAHGFVVLARPAEAG